jgi:threonine dehydrogenase-like Zn-dependent dehydrogenase
VGVATWARPHGRVQRVTPGASCSAFQPGACVAAPFAGIAGAATMVFASDNTCEICRAGYQSRCVQAEMVGASGTQAELARIPLADGTLVATPELPPAELIPSLLASPSAARRASPRSRTSPAGSARTRTSAARSRSCCGRNRRV